MLMPFAYQHPNKSEKAYSVSYRRLDVYKRQLQEELLLEDHLLLKEEMFQHPDTPYEDVYKRQLYQRGYATVEDSLILMGWLEEKYLTH